MGYACPVCEAPQRDGEHLANHLAFTAMLRSDEHEEWLDDRVPDWGGRSPEELAAEVTPHADEADYDEVFEDTAGGAAREFDADAARRRGGAAGADAATEEALREARELTREMRGDEPDDEGKEP